MSDTTPPPGAHASKAAASPASESGSDADSRAEATDSLSAEAPTSLSADASASSGDASPTDESQSGSSTPRILLLDGHSLAYRAFYALPEENFSTSTGQPTNAVYGFISMLINTLRDERPTHVAVAFDVSRKTFRAERFPEYKAQRAASPEGFAGQVELVQEVLDAMGIRWLQKEGFEADDIIATLAKQGERAGGEVLILTGDRDAFQLVDEHTTVLYPKRGVSELARMDPQAVTAKYGVPPEVYPDLAALVGDASDNLPGVPGVGPGFASKWLNKYQNLDGVVAHADEIGGKKGESLREHIDQVQLNRSLNQMVLDLDLPVELPDLALKPFDRQRVNEVFDVLQFRALRDRLFEALDMDDAEGESLPEVDVETLASGQLAVWLAARGSGDAGAVFGVACLGTWSRGTGDLWGVAICAPDRMVAWVDLEDISGDDEAELRSWLADPAVPKAMHDAKGQLLAFQARGWELAGLRMDTMLAAYLILPGRRDFNLGDLVLRFLGRELDEAAETEQLSLDGTDDGPALRIGRTAAAIADLTPELEQKLADNGASQLLTDLEIPLAGVLARMEAVGIAVDVPALTELDQEFSERLRATEARAHEIVGREFNLGSPKQLQEILFEERGLPKTKKIKTGYTTDAESLQKLSAQTDDPLLAELLSWREISKMRQTVAGLIPLVGDDSRIHTTFNQTVAATGRLSSKDPNLQNIPIRTEEGRRIRSAFIVGPGYESMLTADYAQIEMRIMAHLSGDTALAEAIRSGEDLHSTVAARVFDCEPDEVDAEMRRKIKAMSYGLAYGLSSYGLAAQLGVSTAEAEELMTEYFERFGGIRDYLSGVVEEARQKGYTETILGRRRYLPDLNSSNRQRRQMAERMALNSPIQGSAADIIKKAMIEVDAALREAALGSRMLLQVHDELVLEVSPGELDRVTGLVRDRMMGAAELSVPLEVSVGVGRDWDSAGH